MMWLCILHPKRACRSIDGLEPPPCPSILIPSAFLSNLEYVSVTKRCFKIQNGFDGDRLLGAVHSPVFRVGR